MRGRDSLSFELDHARVKRKRANRRAILAWSVGGAVLSGAGFSWYLASQSYEDYNDATISEEAEELRETTERRARTALGLGIAGGACIVAGAVLQAIGPSVNRIERELELLDAEIAALRERD
jgi:hypothetical protein